MRPNYLIKDEGSFQRKVMLDMAWLSSHKQIRLPKYYMEEGIYLLHKSNSNNEIKKFHTYHWNYLLKFHSPSPRLLQLLNFWSLK